MVSGEWNRSALQTSPSGCRPRVRGRWRASSKAVQGLDLSKQLTRGGGMILTLLFVAGWLYWYLRGRHVWGVLRKGRGAQYATWNATARGFARVYEQPSSVEELVSLVKEAVERQHKVR
jgi:hypothetical protein